MADRRMFSKTIIDSDQFLDMPLSTQSLYFHLSMRADDEGFVNNPRKVQRMIGASDDDFKVLITKNFIIPFESGIVVIKHWRIHNYIRADRLVPTTCKAEKACLETVDDGVYELCEETKEIELLDATDVRKAAYKQSTLPYSFSYKIKRAFEGLACPICGRTMTSSYKTTMPTVQHNIPISKGGEHELGNISVICESCNTSIRDKETDALNNAKVIELWDKIIAADRAKIKWFDEPRMLDNLDVSQLSVNCQSSDGQMSAQVRLGKDRVGKDRIGKDKTKSALTALEEMDLSDDLKEALRNFIDMRKGMKKPMSERALQLLLDKLRKMASDEPTQIAIVNQSIMSGWLSLYPLKEEPRYGKTGVRLADTTDHELDEVFSLGSSWSE